MHQRPEGVPRKYTIAEICKLILNLQGHSFLVRATNCFGCMSSYHTSCKDGRSNLITTHEDTKITNTSTNTNVCSYYLFVLIYPCIYVNEIFDLHVCGGTWNNNLYGLLFTEFLVAIQTTCQKKKHVTEDLKHFPVKYFCSRLNNIWCKAKLFIIVTELITKGNVVLLA